jgi:hypothetical protein
MASGVRGAADTTRTVYLSAIDANGAFVSDLKPTDVVVKENGEAREVSGLARATDPCHIAVLVDDGGEGLMQKPVMDLVTAAAGLGPISISMLNPQAIRLNDFTTDTAAIQKSIDKISPRGRLQRDTLMLADAVDSTARDMQKRKLSRPAIIVLTNGLESAEPQVAREILGDLRDSGAALHVIRVVGLDLGAVMTDGPVQSGGSSVVASSTNAFSGAMAAIAARLAHEYQLTYVLPNGTKPNERVQVTTTRPNVKIVAPTRVPTK